MEGREVNVGEVRRRWGDWLLIGPKSHAVVAANSDRQSKKLTLLWRGGDGAGHRADRRPPGGAVHAYGRRRNRFLRARSADHDQRASRRLQAWQRQQDSGDQERHQGTAHPEDPWARQFYEPTRGRPPYFAATRSMYAEHISATA